MGRAGLHRPYSLAVAFLSGRPRLGLQNIGLNKGRSVEVNVRWKLSALYRLAWPAFHNFMEASTIE